MRTLIVCLLATALPLCACQETKSGKSKKGDDAGDTIDTDMIPSSFRNTATSKTDLADRAAAINTAVVSDVGTALYLSSRGSRLEDASSVTGMSGFGDALKTGLADGGNCETFWTNITEFFSNGTQGFSSISTQLSNLGDDFSAQEVDGYTVTDVADSSGKYAFHYKLKPTGEGVPAEYASLMPTIEIAAGAGATDYASLYKMSMALSGMGMSSNASMTMDMSATTYADTATNTLKFGIDTAVKSTSDRTSTDMTMQATGTLTGGTTPSFVQTTVFTGTVDGTATSGNFELSVSKVSEGELSLKVEGKAGSESFNKTVLITKSASSCTVH